MVVSRSPEQQALHLLRLLEPRVESIRRYVSDPDYLVRVLFWWESVVETAGFDLSSGTVVRLAALSNYIGVTVLTAVDGEAAELGSAAQVKQADA